MSAGDEREERPSRLFFALWPPVELARAVADEVGEALADSPACARPTREEHVHLTLQFLGEVTASRASALVEALSGAEPGRAPALQVAGPGAFPRRGRERVLWLGVEDASDTGSVLADLQAEVEALARGTGWTPDRRSARTPFRPHLTVARRDPRQAASVPEAFYTMASRHSWRPTEVQLVRSVLGARPEERFELLARAPLLERELR